MPPSKQRTTLPCVRGAPTRAHAGDAAAATTTTTDERDLTATTTSTRHVTAAHTRRTCTQACMLPDYALLAQPRTNNYYAAIGHGCPCIPRAAAHPGSWRLRAAQMRCAAHHYRTDGNDHHSSRSSSSNKDATTAAGHRNNGHAYGWRPGPHRVPPTCTAAAGACDTFGNLAFKSRRPGVYVQAVTTARDAMARRCGDGAAGRTAVSCDDVDTDDGDNAVASTTTTTPGSVTREQLQALEARILAEHRARVCVEEDMAELRATQEEQAAAAAAAADNDAADDTASRGADTTHTGTPHVASPFTVRGDAAIAAHDVRTLLRDVRDVAARPLWQTNPSTLQRIIARHTRRSGGGEAAGCAATL